MCSCFLLLVTYGTSTVLGTVSRDDHLRLAIFDTQTHTYLHDNRQKIVDPLQCVGLNPEIAWLKTEIAKILNLYH